MKDCIVTTIDEMRTEGVKRLKKLRIHPNAIKEFKDKDKLNYSLNPLGALYWLDDRMKKAVDDFENEYNCIVYHVIYSKTAFGVLLNLLYVSTNKEEWDDDNIDLEKMLEYTENGKRTRFYNPYSYVINLDAPECSEFGRIGVVPRFGGVARVF